MRAWWTGREPREQLLLGVLGGLLLVFALVFAVILPLADARADADRALDRARAGYDIVARTSPATSGDTSARAPFDRAALLEAARAQGLQITRIQPADGAGLSVWIDDAQTAPLYALFDTLLTEYSGRMDRVVVSADNAGRLSAQFTIRP